MTYLDKDGRWEFCVYDGKRYKVCRFFGLYCIVDKQDKFIEHGRRSMYIERIISEFPIKDAEFAIRQAKELDRLWKGK